MSRSETFTRMNDCDVELISVDRAHGRESQTSLKTVLAGVEKEAGRSGSASKTMQTIQTSKNMPNGGADEHSRPTSSSTSSGKQKTPSSHRELHTEAYGYDRNSNKAPPAGEYLRAPVCCSECEEFWKALILEVDEKHTSRVAAGKASLIMAKGGSGSVLQIKSKKHVTKEKRFLPRLGCKNVTVRGDAFHSCQSAAARQISSNPTSIKRGYYRGKESPQKKFSNHKTPAYSGPSPFANKSGLSRQYELQGSLHTRYNAYGAAPKYDVVTTPRRHCRGHIQGHEHKPKGAAYRESRPSFTQTRSNHLSSDASQVHLPEAVSSGQDFEPMHSRVDKRSEESSSHLSTPRCYIPIYSESFRNSHGLQNTDSSPSRPSTPTTTRFSEKVISREDVSQPATLRVYSSLPRASLSQERHVEDFLHYDYPTTTPQTPSSRWGTQKYKEHHMSTSAGGKASRSQRETCNTYGVDITSPKYPLKQEVHLQSGHENANPERASNGERNLSRTSTIESGYTTLSIPLSDSSSNSLNGDLDGSESKRDTETLGAQDLTSRDRFNIPARNNLSRTSTGTSSLLEPIMLFTGHGCRSETDEDDDINPNYFKHIITNPKYIKHIVKPLGPPPPPPGLTKKDLTM